MNEGAQNLFKTIPRDLPEELYETLCRSNDVRIERIVSKGHKSAEGFWYDQDENEFVVLLKGKARLLFEGGETLDLEAGDYLDIKAHVRHRVEWTSSEEEAVWLAVFYK